MSDDLPVIELRDAIAAAVHHWSFEAGDDFYAAEDVLELPELQAIRKALRDVAEEDRYAFGGITLPAESLADRGLPPSVVAWVLEGEA